MSYTPEEIVFQSITERFSIPKNVISKMDLREPRQRVSELAKRIPVINKLANDQRIGEIEHIEDAAPLLLRNSTYGSYPMMFL